ncbi:MAG: helix-turn-helix transcriptional regulator [Marinilabiliaceae bacterium]|nr:helix-turn-helix transcriptional regulator [Marinilabiliaceae bacterium]
MKQPIVSCEVTALNDNSDTFLVFDRIKSDFIYPLHFHPEYEINCIIGAKGVKRVMGDSVEEISDIELCIVGPNLYHVWQKGNYDGSKPCREITIQFNGDILSSQLLEKQIFRSIADMFQRSSQGVTFAEESIRNILPIITTISEKRGFESFISLLNLLHAMSVAPYQRQLAHVSFQQSPSGFTDERVEQAYNYLKDHYFEKIKVEEVAQAVRMSTVSFTRLIKNRTGKCFVDFLNDIRIGYAARLMVDSNKTISEICYSCGFNNISNFNRVFKHHQSMTPSEYRNAYQGSRKVY